jgi:ribonuclease R
VGEESGETYRVGQYLELKLVEANPASGALRFELPEGKFAGPSRTPQRRDRVRSSAGKRGRPNNIRHQGRRR